MVEQDTVKLLRECDAGVKMGVSSIDEVIGVVGSERLREYLEECKAEHKKLESEIEGLLEELTRAEIALLLKDQHKDSSN